MRCNIYAEELTDRVEIISKTTEAGTFLGLRFYLELPICVPSSGGHSVSHRGPFIHRPGDDDSSAVTFWGKQDMRRLLRKALAELDKHYDRASIGGQVQAGATPGQYEGNIKQHSPNKISRNTTAGDPIEETVDQYLTRTKQDPAYKPTR